MADQPVVAVHGLANGGEGVARLDDGRALFVAGAWPGETVRVELTEQRKRFARARLVAVLEPSPDRVEPPCRWQREGCGGCDLMHVTLDAQRDRKRRLAVDALERIGRLDAPLVLTAPPLPGVALRTTVRVAVREGRAAYRRRSSHELVAVSDCLVAHPRLAELLAEGRFGRAREVTLRVSAATGERIAVVSPGVRAAGRLSLPADVAVVGADELRVSPGDPGAPDPPGAGRAAGRSAGRSGPGRSEAPDPDEVSRAGHHVHFHEVVAERRWRVSAGSFFQTSAVGAEALVDAVRHALADADADAVSGGLGAVPGATVPCRALDAYCGVGLLSAAFGPHASIVAIESSPSSVRDAAVNLADRSATVLQQRFERWRPEPMDVAIADPARRGLGRAGAEVLAATGASVVVLVSCDLASLGRDSGDLVSLGYRHVRSSVLDLFPHTSHAEVVTRFERR